MVTTTLILTPLDDQRRLYAFLREIDRSARQSLTVVWQRLQGLEDIEDASMIVPVVDGATGESFEALIEKTTFTKRTPSEPTQSNQGFLEVLLRKLA